MKLSWFRLRKKQDADKLAEPTAEAVVAHQMMIEIKGNNLLNSSNAKRAGWEEGSIAPGKGAA